MKVAHGFYWMRFLAFVLMLIPYGIEAQKAILRGTVIDDDNGEPLFSANAVIKGTEIGATTDFDGNFELKADPGTYDLKVSFIGMSSTTITGVELKAGETKVIDLIRLKPASNELETVTVTAESVRNTEAAMITVKKKSPNLMDGISAAELKETGDGNVGEAVKRVTGVSLVGGKYVYVRGLGDRYTKTTLNGIDIPGLDPDRNALQIDIFPTSIVSNLNILKTGLADLSAEFSGGLVDIETKAFPSKKTMEVSAGLGYNPSMHFNDQYLSYPGSGTDFLGFDGGMRELPEGGRAAFIPSPSSPGYTNGEINNFMQDFSSRLGAERSMSPMDFNLGFSAGDQMSLDNGAKWGYIFSAGYRQETKFYDDVKYGEYQVPDEPDTYEMNFATKQEGELSKQNTLLSGLAGLAYKTLKSKFKLTVMHLQNGETRAGKFLAENDGSAVGQSGYLAISDNLEYSERRITNVLLQGEHFLEGGDWEIDWSLSPTFSSITEPDNRQTRFTIFPSGDSLFVAGAGGNPKRIWRYLDEVNAMAKANVLRKFRMNGKDYELKFGGSHTYKQRDYEILTYDLQAFNTAISNVDFGGDPSAVLLDSNLYPQGPGVYYASGNGPPGQNPNAYSSSVQNPAGYASLKGELSEQFRATLGLRAEFYQQRHTGRDSRFASSGGVQGNNLDDEIVLESLDLFPSFNATYEPVKDMNFRLAYFRSIARPSFKELSFAQILDPLSNRIFNGGLFQYQDPDGTVTWDGNLSSTRIDNFDFRWEMYPSATELYSVSLFYKKFDDPIEMVRIPQAQTSAEFQPRNVGQGELFGAEFEARKSLEFIAPSLKEWSANANLTLVRSRIRMTDLEFNNRKDFEKPDQTVDRFRPMAGQAPYIINAGLSYNLPEMGLRAGMFYNVKGATLVYVGGGLFPDVYSDPFHNLKITANKKFGDEEQHSVGFEVSNLLNDTFDQYNSSFRASNKPFTFYSPGVSGSVSYTYRF